MLGFGLFCICMIAISPVLDAWRSSISGDLAIRLGSVLCAGSCCQPLPAPWMPALVHPLPSGHCSQVVVGSRTSFSMRGTTCGHGLLGCSALMHRLSRHFKNCVFVIDEMDVVDVVGWNV